VMLGVLRVEIEASLETFKELLLGYEAVK